MVWIKLSASELIKSCLLLEESTVLLVLLLDMTEFSLSRNSEMFRIIFSFKGKESESLGAHMAVFLCLMLFSELSVFEEGLSKSES